MKKPPEPRPVFDPAKGRRNPYAGRVWTGNARRLDDDVAKEFPDSESVNQALRLVIALRAAVAPRRRRKVAA